MGELEERLNALLQNPEDIGRIAQRASRLMGQIAPGEGEKAAADPPPGVDPGMMGTVGRILSRMNDNGGKKQLLTGLSPYLAPKRRQRLEKSLRIASAAGLAGAAFSELGGEGDG